MTSPIMRIVMSVSCLLILFGGARSTRQIPAVTGFDLSRYSGTWYEIARMPHRFEKGLTDVKAEYTPGPDGLLIIRNSGYDPGRGKWRSAEGKARIAGAPDVGLLRVTFFWPFSATYRIIEVDKDNYQHALVTSGTVNYLWILSRRPQLDRDVYDALVGSAAAQGFDVSRLQTVSQERNISALIAPQEGPLPKQQQ